MTDLNQPALFSALDHQDMLGHIRRWPDQCRQAWTQIQEFARSFARPTANGVVILGMGGSAIGGDLLISLSSPSSPVPMTMNRSERLPRWAGHDTVVIASSYSGNTEETLAAFETARRRGCFLVALSSGGELADAAYESGSPWLQIPYQSPPRAAAGYSFILLVGLAQWIGLISDQSQSLEEAEQLLTKQQNRIGVQVLVAHNPAKQLALESQGRLPFVYAEGLLAPVARRWKTQINENAKSWAAWEELPELDHNTVAGFGLPKPVRDRVLAIALTSQATPPRHRLRFDIISDLLLREGIAHREVSFEGETPLAQMISAIQFGDYVSYYLAMLYGVDPTEIANIQLFKERLGRHSQEP